MADPEAITPEQHHDSGDWLDSPLSDDALLDLLDDLVDRRGRVPAAEVLGVNYRTVARCQQSRQVSRRMRQALQEYRDTLEVSEDESDADPGVGSDDAEDVMADSAAELERENWELRETISAQAEELEALRRRVAELEELGHAQSGNAGIPDSQEPAAKWHPPRRGHGLPDAGVVTLERQPDEAHAFGPAASLVARWREARARMGDATTASHVDRAEAAVRRWELEVQMLRDYHLTLPPETAPLDASRRNDHMRWREEALAEAQRTLARAKRWRLLRCVLSLDLWRG